MRNISITLLLFSLSGAIGFQNIYAEECKNLDPISIESANKNISEPDLKVMNEYTSDQVIEDKDSKLTIDAKSRVPINGVVKEFYESSHAIKETVEYKNGKINGSSKGYYENGKLYFEGNFINGSSVGSIKLYDENGKLISEMFSKDGIVEGLVKNYYKNGNLNTEVMLRDGKPEGLVKNYYESGKINEEKIYKNGKLEGISKIFSEETGKIIKEIQFKNNVQDGIVRNYYENGTLKEEFKIKNRKIYGDYFLYLENGKLCANVLYKDDHPISGKKSNGKKLNKAELLKLNNGASIQCE
ncbi:MAG: toxin-antitoxin system YwqK family antitoxin [Silvanigrellaceae bacterium]|nr:toxin-antitoxin system YwqK family antitoxin [Silvanigrellaceae bacterium]